MSGWQGREGRKLNRARELRRHAEGKTSESRHERKPARKTVAGEVAVSPIVMIAQSG